MANFRTFCRRKERRQARERLLICDYSATKKRRQEREQPPYWHKDGDNEGRWRCCGENGIARRV